MLCALPEPLSADDTDPKALDDELELLESVEPDELLEPVVLVATALASVARCTPTTPAPTVAASSTPAVQRRVTSRARDPLVFMVCPFRSVQVSCPQRVVPETLAADPVPCLGRACDLPSSSV